MESAGQDPEEILTWHGLAEPPIDQVAAGRRTPRVHSPVPGARSHPPRTLQMARRLGGAAQTLGPRMPPLARHPLATTPLRPKSWPGGLPLDLLQKAKYPPPYRTCAPRPAGRSPPRLTR